MNTSFLVRNILTKNLVAVKISFTNLFEFEIRPSQIILINILLLHHFRYFQTIDNMNLHRNGLQLVFFVMALQNRD